MDFQIQHFHVEDGKVVLTASAPAEHLKNRTWNEIKKVDPGFADFEHDIPVGSATMGVVKSGDNLSNISKSFYGNPNDYTEIARRTTFPTPTKFKQAIN